MAIPDLFWLLLPVAAAAGWFAAKHSDARSSDAFWDNTRNFHQGLSVLFSEQQDKAAELFDALAESDNNADSDAQRDTADTHIALGNLYRRRGEIERAILLHESVINKESLPEEARDTARYELARDYDSAGLMDRSEKVFRELTASPHRRDDAYHSLLQLHEREHDWQQAIAVAVESQQNTREKCDRRIAHYYCELALLATKAGKPIDAEAMLASALRHWPDCARALIMQAELALGTGDNERALKLYDRVETLQPLLMPEIIDNRFKALMQAGNEENIKAFIKRIQGQRNAYSVIRRTREVIASLHSEQLADRFFKDQILKRPSLKGLRDWAQDQVALSKPGERDKVQVICDLLDQVVEDKPAYRCHSCGFQGNVMHWRCPGCSSWDSVTTIIGVEGE